MELIREIIVPTSNTYMLNLPDKLIGKKVEVIAFEIEEKPASNREENIRKFNESLANLNMNREQKLSKIQEIFKDSLVDLSNFKFDRDEANNYDE